MRYGVFFPTAKIGNDPEALKKLATSTEQMGFDYIAAPDHVVQAGQPIEEGWRAQYTRDFPHHEPLLLFSFMASITSRIRFQTAVLILAQRPAVLVAKQAAELDVLSGGRAELGIGIGWNELEFTALHQNFRDRGRRVEEQIEVMRKLWTEELVTFRGEWHEVTDAGLAPMPVQRPIPLWIGAFAKPAVARAGRLADGWLLKPQLLPADDETHELLGVYREAAASVGRDASTLGLGATLHLNNRGVNAWVDEVGAWNELGATQITVRTSTADYSELQQHLDIFQQFREAVAAQ
jgi:probable F420-dependent oxidoreductase